MHQLSLDSKIKQNPQVNYSIVDNELIILGPDDNISYRVNKVGAVLWSLLAVNAQTLSDIAKHLQQSYQLAEDRAIQDATAFVEMMLNKNILTLIEI